MAVREVLRMAATSVVGSLGSGDRPRRGAGDGAVLPAEEDVTVFVSYARAQFYLAEDLALALRQRGVDAWLDVDRLEPGDDWEDSIATALRSAECVLLVASREALRSAHVQAELEIARDTGMPVVVALAENVALPAQLEPAATVPVRRRFERRVDSLVRAIRGGSVGSSRPRWPSAPVFVPLALVISALLCAAMSLGLLLPQVDENPGLAQVVVIYGGAAVFCLWLAWEFVRRRPRRTMLVFGALGATAALAVLLAVLIPVVVIVVVGDPDFGGILLLWAGAGLLVVPFFWAIRSPTVYRWLPTGDASRRLRARMLRRRGVRPRVETSAQITYALRCHELDSAVASNLDDALRRCGHRPAEARDADRGICVVSNLTPASWLAETLAEFRGRVVMVIAAAVPATALQDVSRYQWVDYRRRRPGTLANLASTIGGSTRNTTPELVPENLSARVVPFGILAVTVMYALSAITLVGTAVTRVAGTDPYNRLLGAPPSPVTSIPLLAVAISLSAGTAFALITRRVPPRIFLALFAASIASTVAVYLHHYPAAPAWTALTSPVIGAVVLAVAWRSIKNWLPARRVPPNIARVAPANTNLWRSPGARRVALLVALVSTMMLGTAALADDAPDPATTNALQSARTEFDQWFASVARTGPKRTSAVQALSDAIHAANAGQVGDAIEGFDRALSLSREYEDAIRSLPSTLTTLADVNRELDWSARQLSESVANYRQAATGGNQAAADEAERAAEESDDAARRALSEARTYWEFLGGFAVFGPTYPIELLRLDE
jgi:hypothetical protein